MRQLWNKKTVTLILPFAKGEGKDHAVSAKEKLLLRRGDRDLFLVQLDRTDLIKQLMFAIHCSHNVAE
jgi:hypothetical protein